MPFLDGFTPSEVTAKGEAFGLHAISADDKRTGEILRFAGRAMSKREAAILECDRIIGMYSGPLVGEDDAERVKRLAILGIVTKIMEKLS